MIIILICLMVFSFSAAYLGLYYKDKGDAQKDMDKLAELNTDMGLESVWDENSDTIGWVTLDNTRIDYPVMQTKEDPEYYIYRDFNRDASDAGTPFMASDSDVGSSRGEGATWNWLIYGHNIKSGIMFHDLLKYEDENFWKSNRTFTLSVFREGKVKTYEFLIFAAGRSRILEKGEKGFRYYQYSGYTDENTFNEFVKGVKGLSSYDTGIDPRFGDQLVTLSTCAYHTDEGRFFISGVRR